MLIHARSEPIIIVKTQGVGRVWDGGGGGGGAERV